MRQEFTQELKNIYHTNMQNIHTAVPGKILSFDPDKCEAKIKPAAKYRKPDGSFIDFPDIFHAPVYFPQGIGQTATIVYPVRPGDECLVLFSEQALDYWRTGAESETDLRFDLTNAIVIVGLFARPNPLVKRAYDNESIIIRRGGSYIEIYENRIDMFSPGDINITSGTHIQMTAPRIDLNPDEGHWDNDQGHWDNDQGG